MSTSKVAIVTGGASGIGFEVAKSLVANDWLVYILYHKSPYKIAEVLNKAHIKQADVASWESLSAAFEEIFRESRRLDFVFANAGVVSEVEFFTDMTGKSIDPVGTLPIDVNLKGAIFTSRLACRYFSKSPNEGRGATLLINASSTVFYESAFAPVYGASKAGVLSFMRSISRPLFQHRGIRVHAICPGPVYTTLVRREVWAAFPAKHFIPVEHIVTVVSRLMDDGPFVDSNSKCVAPESKFGLAVEIGTSDCYIREIQRFSDPTAQSSMAILARMDSNAAEDGQDVFNTKQG